MASNTKLIVDASAGPVEIYVVNDFVLNSNINKIHLDGYDIDNFKGGITIRDRKMSLDNTSMDLLGGKVIQPEGTRQQVQPDQHSILRST